jgi:HAUS augmin-like complex subunit 3
VLQGKDLEDALRAVRTETDVSDIDDLQYAGHSHTLLRLGLTFRHPLARAEIAALEEEYNVAKSDLRDVVRQRDHMQAQLSNAQTKNKAIQQLAQKRTDQFHRTISQKLAQRNAQMNDVLKGLSSVSTEFVQQHVADSTGSLFLSTAPLNEYYEQDDVYTSHVRRYMKQYLGSATGEAVADDNDAILNDPSLQFIRGIDAETHAKNCQEMNRLQNAFVSYFYAIFQAQMTNDTITASYAASELDKIQADLLLVRTKAAYDTVKLQLLREQQYYAIDAATLKCADILVVCLYRSISLMNLSLHRHKISEAKSGITKSKQSLKRQLDTAVAETLSELAQLQSTTILWGDYNLKIARQHYKIFKQQKVLSTQ